jgi:UDP-N-acetylglucosamine transferase subunit ALG13
VTGAETGAEARAVTRLVASVGTDHHPFARMLEWVAAAQQQMPDLDVTVQRGATPPLAGLQTVEYMGAAELERLMTEADVVVCHGGPGTISLAVRCGHRPIVIARDPSLGEHVDDHQMRYTARLHAEGQIDMPTDLASFLQLVSADRPRTARSTAAGPEIEATARFAALVQQLTSGALPRRTLRQRILLRRVP